MSGGGRRRLTDDANGNTMGDSHTEPSHQHAGGTSLKLDGLDGVDDLDDHLQVTFSRLEKTAKRFSVSLTIVTRGRYSSLLFPFVFLFLI